MYFVQILKTATPKWTEFYPRWNPVSFWWLRSAQRRPHRRRRGLSCQDNDYSVAFYILDRWQNQLISRQIAPILFWAAISVHFVSFLKITLASYTSVRSQNATLNDYNWRQSADVSANLDSVDLGLESIAEGPDESILTLRTTLHALLRLRVKISRVQVLTNLVPFHAWACASQFNYIEL